MLKRKETSAKGYSVFKGMNLGCIKLFCQTARKGTIKKEKREHELLAGVIIKHCANKAKSEKKSPN